MPIGGYMGYSFSRFADRRSREAEANRPSDIVPLQPGEDPLAALDPETRALVVSLEPAIDPEAEDGTTIGDRIGAGLVGAGIGAFVGAVLVNGTSRRYHFRTAPAMDVGMTLMAAATGAAIGGIAGFSKGHDPLRRDVHDVVDAAVPGSSTPTLTPVDLSHPAFASLHG